MERDMKRTIIQYTTVVLAFLAGMIFMTYMTRMGNRDMTGDMAQAQLPVVYAEQDGVLYNEMHGYVEDMDGASMRDSVIGVSEDHKVGLALEKYNAQIKSVSYEVRSLDMSRLIEGGDDLQAEDDGKYLHVSLTLKDLLTQGEEYLLVTPGNYGADYLREHMDLPYEKNIKCSNYVGETIDMAIDMGVKGILFIAHIGKFVKVAAGIMNTHSHSADARMEVLASNAIRAGASLECAKEILNASTTDEAIDILEKYQILQKTMKEILDRIQFYLNHRSYEQILLGAVIFNNTYGYLGQTADAEKLIKLINAQNDEAQ